MKKLAFFGSGDFAQSIIPIALSTGQYEIFGYFEDFSPKGTIVNGYPVYGTATDAIRMYKRGMFDCIFIAMGYNHFDVKEQIYNKFKGIIPLATIIAPSAIVDSTSVIGEGTCVAPYSRIGKECVVGDNVWLSSTILGHNNRIGSHSYFAGGIQIAGFTNIGERCFLGIHSIVADHITITDDVWIGLGMIVCKNIKKPGKYAVAQRIIKIE